MGSKFEELLTKIWTISVIMKLENKILMPIFEEIQKKHTIANTSHLIKLFLKLTKMNKNDYDFISNSFLVKSFIYKQEKFQKFIKLSYVPTIIICGKYIINNKFFNQQPTKNIVSKYIKIIQFLLKKENKY